MIALKVESRNRGGRRIRADAIRRRQEAVTEPTCLAHATAAHGRNVDIVHRSSLVAHWMFESSANAFSCFDGRLGRFSCRAAFSCRGRRGGPAGRRRGSGAAAEATASATARRRLGDGPRDARLLVGRAFARKTTEKTPQLPQRVACEIKKTPRRIPRRLSFVNRERITSPR